MTIERLKELTPLEYARHYNDCGLGWGMGDGTTRGAEARELIGKLIDAEIERQEPCDACNNGKHGKKFKIDIEFGKRISLNFCYCPTCGRKLDQQ